MQRAQISIVVPAVAAGFALVTAMAVTWLRADPPAVELPAPGGVAVIELFTSEGCSSCPSADAALAEVVHAANGKPVYALAFHVDYWDRLGWPDRFATKAYTERQVAYAAALKLDNVYTPQAIVNGSRAFFGSDREQLSAAIADGLATPVLGTIAATATRVDDNITLAITTTHLPAAAIINAALVEDGLTTDVRRGENEGRTLPHEHVVRAFASTTADDHGRAATTLSIPTDVRLDRTTIILFAQQPGDLRVHAAVDIHLPK